MQKTSIKRNILLILIAAILAAAFVFVSSFTFARSSAAEGNNAGSIVDANPDVDLILDVNGEDATKVNELVDAMQNDQVNTTVAANNSKNIKTRVLTSRVVVTEYNAKHSNAITNVSSWKFDDQSVKNGSPAFEVSFSGTSQIIIKAVKATSSENGGRFSVGMTDGSRKITVYFNVRVRSTLAQYNRFGSTSNDNMLYVGGVVSGVNGDVEETVTPFEISNFANVTIRLDEYLVGRALYMDKERKQPIKMGSTGTFWTVSSADNFVINASDNSASSGLGFVSGAFTNVLAVNPTAEASFAPYILAKTTLRSNIINDYTYTLYPELANDPDARAAKFWEETHYVKIRFKTVGASATDQPYTINIPVRFKPANPQTKSVNSQDFALNVSSQYYKNLSDGKYYNKAGEVQDNLAADAGFNSIIIRPSDLVEYSAPSSYSNLPGKEIMVFSATDTTGLKDIDSNVSTYDNAFYSIEKYGESNATSPNPTVLKLTLKQNGSYDINFAVKYFTSNGTLSESPIIVTVPVSGFGFYAVKIPNIKGKHAVSYNVLDTDNNALFAQLVSDGYQLTDAVSNDKTKLMCEFNNPILKLTPQTENLHGQEIVSLTLTFTNSDSQTVTLVTNEITIDVNAGSFWARFDDWQAWLIIAACIIAGIALILLIVFLFIRGVSKRREAENATQAPLSSYIVKLNSTIAATQAQRLAATQALNQANQMMLAAGTTTTTTGVVPPTGTVDTLQLATGVPSQPMPTDSTPNSAPEPAYSEPRADSNEDLIALIAKYISDEELLERIYTEKYEPKGMIRRTFFKSKDTMTRELDKEKARIIERYKTPMPMDEAIMSEAEIRAAAVSSAPRASEPQEEEAQVFVIDLGFDPDSPLVPEKVKDEFSEEKIDIDLAPEEARLNELLAKSELLEKELAELKRRLEKVEAENNKNNSAEDDVNARITALTEENAQCSKEIEDLEFKLASAKAKEKDKIKRDITIKEEKVARNEEEITRLRNEFEARGANTAMLTELLARYNAMQATKIAEKDAIASDIEKAQADFDAYQERLAVVQARKELEAKVEGLTPMLVTVNTDDYELRNLDEVIAKMEKEREDIKTSVAAAKAQLLGANDFDVINDLNTQISELGAKLSEMEKDITKSTKRKSELNIEFKSQRRKANEYVEQNDIPLEDVISAEDKVIGDIELNSLRATCENDREEAEHNVAAAQAVYDDLSASSNDITMVAMEIAADIKDLESELETVQAELDALNAQMEVAGDDEKLMLMVEQGDKADKVEELKERLKQANVDGTKRKMEVQSEYDEKLEAARKGLEDANEEFKNACEKYDRLVGNTDPLDLIMSGSGIISQDQKKRETESLKKQLERSKNEIEQARLAAQMAQMEAEQARVDAARASDAAREEAERMAQEAIEKAEAARLEAEEKARLEAEAAERARLEKEEAEERMRREAEEAEERARQEAEEAERLRLEEEERLRLEEEEAARLAAEEQARLDAEESEQARIEAEEAAERARQEAEEAERLRLEAEAEHERELEEARREAEEAAERAKREAEEAVERAKREAEEAILAEAEEAKRKAQEEIEEMKRKAEEEAEAKRLEEENRRREEEERLQAENAHKEAVAKKVAARKEQIISVRNRMKDITGEEDAKNMREELFTQQLSYDEDERGSTELMDFYNKTMDDIQNAGEIAKLKAENAKKPKRVVRKVTERVTRKPKKGARRPGARRPGAAGARRPSSAAGARRPGAAGARRPSSGAARRPGARPGGARPGSTRPPTRH